LSLGSWGCNFTCPFCQNWQISQQEAPFRELTPEQALLPYIDAWNIDLKGFSQDFYQSLCGASLQPVLDTIEAAAAVSHVEVTTLVIPGENDDPAQMDAEARWLASILPDIPLHLTRYFPQYHWSAPVTPVETLKKLQAVASSYLHYIYLGNV
jgi:pyruvate formate lyase activating enzyme